jgi:AcrR family transcriptional regulator
MNADPGLRERKKQQTRELIAEVANRLFLERGFDAVKVADVASAANVSEGTVFNYFPTKEDLFYGRLETFEASLVDAVRDRPADESILAAFRRFIDDRTGRLAAEEVADLIAAAAGIVAASPALQARERDVVDGYTRSLAAVLADQTGAQPGDVEPAVVAGALMGAHRAVVEHVRASVLQGKRGRRLATSARAQAERAFARLERGLDDYGVGSS